MSLIVNIEKKLGHFSLDVNIEVSGILGLLGASGCGKSMTLKCIAGIETPDSGHIVLDGRVLFDSEKHINLAPQQRHVGYLFQNYALFPNMTVEQNILCGLHYEKDKHIRKQTLKRIISDMDLNGLEKHKPYQLSGGQAQRTALARILVNKPELLLLDEPFSALDAYLRDRLQISLLSLLRQYGHDVILVSHNRDEVFRICQTTAVIDSGKILAVQNTRELFANPLCKKSAELTGCKNIVSAEKSGEFEVFIPEWDIYLQTSHPVGENIKAVGIRAHSFDFNEKHNRFPVNWIGKLEEPFEWTAEFMYCKQRSDSKTVWCRFPKSTDFLPDAKMLGVAPENVLLLY